MDMTHTPLPAWLLMLSWGGWFCALALALVGGALQSVLLAARGHLYPAALVSLLLLWQLRAVTPLGPAFHVLGATLLVLMVGWRAALVGLCIVLIGHTANGAGDWGALGLNALSMVVAPVLVSQLVLQQVRRRFASHPFGYILLSGFAGAGAAMAACLTVSSLVLLLASSLDPDHLLAQFTLTGVLMLFPEAFLTGTTVAWLAMFYPAALCTWTPPWARAGDGR